MKGTVSSYLDLVHRVKAQITANEAIKAHRQQFEVSHKRKRGQEHTPRWQENRPNEECCNDECRRDHHRDLGQQSPQV
ncbi:hypothetical protein KSP40_PGU008188 [Platanthera guangdongensis]|uniref:Uncharacterized protein n=1 Tax=Platanthera guangdongensis TaxID=2320717 RepID=A0ABR2MT05_9ASPA